MNQDELCKGCNHEKEYNEMWPHHTCRRCNLAHYFAENEIICSCGEMNRAEKDKYTDIDAIPTNEEKVEIIQNKETGEIISVNGVSFAPKEIGEWEARFDQTFPYAIIDWRLEESGAGTATNKMTEIKDFIRSLLTAIDGEITKAKRKTRPCDNCYNRNGMSDKECSNCDSARGYNSALTHARSIISKHMKG